MSNEPAQKRTQSPDRTPIQIERLLISHTNPNGVKLPDGLQGQSERLCHTVTAGDLGDVRVRIEHLPWMRVFRVTKTRKVTRTGKPDAWEPMGRAFHIPDVWCVSIPAGE